VINASTLAGIVLKSAGIAVQLNLNCFLLDVQIKNKFCVFHNFLGTFAKLPEATVSSVMSAYSPAANNKLPAGWIFMKFDI
jgi:hypothetical protein